MKKIAVLYGGGTISSIRVVSGYRTGGDSPNLIAELQQHKPTYQLSFLQIDTPIIVYTGLSENIDAHYQNIIFEHIQNTINKHQYQGILLTFGTDAMREMSALIEANFLKELTNGGITLIITGANQDTTHPQTDAWDNLYFALSCFNETPAGVWIAFDGRLVKASRAVMEPFSGAMRFRDKEDAEYIKLNEQRNQKRAELAKKFTHHTTKSVIYYLNTTQLKSHDNLLRALRQENIWVVIFVLFHSGTANVENQQISAVTLISTLIKEYQVLCLGTTENGEPTTLNGYETSVALRKAGLIPLNMDYQIAQAKVNWLIEHQQITKADELIRLLFFNYFGEIENSGLTQHQIQEYQIQYAHLWKK